MPMFMRTVLCSKKERDGERGKKKGKKEGQLEMRQKKEDLGIGRNELYGNLNFPWPITH